MTLETTQFPAPKVNLPQVLPDIMKQYLDRQLTRNLYRVLSRRRNLQGQDNSKWTLGRVGQELGYSRERARQVEAICFKRLHTAFILRNPTKMSLDGEVLDEIEVLCSILLTQGELCFDGDWQKLVEARYDYKMTPQEAAHMRVLYEVAGFEFIQLPHSDLIWKSPSVPYTPTMIKKLMSTCMLVLKRGAIPMTVKALAAKIPNSKKNPRPKDSVIHFVLRANAIIEEMPDGRYQVKFSRLGSGARYAYRILWESCDDPANPPDPMYSAEIYKRISERLAAEGGRPVSKGTVVNGMTRTPDLFVSIGKSGYWGLREWGLKNAYIADLIMDCFENLQKPCHSSEIYDCVKQSRKNVSPHSVTTYLASRNGLFVRLAPGVYQPKAWDRPAKKKS